MKYTFLILSNQQFGFPLKTNKWHISTRLAKLGHHVVFVDPPLRFRALSEFLKTPSFNLLKLFFGVEKRSDNLIIYKPANIFNFWLFSFLNVYIHSRKIKKLLKDRSHKLVVWVYHFDFPDLENFLSKFHYDLLVYDVVDEYTAFPEYAERKKVTPSVISWIQWIDDELKIYFNQKRLSGTKWVIYREKWLVSKADLVFASAPGLVKKFKKWKQDVYYLPNAADIKKFNINKKLVKEPKDLREIPHPRIGFTGAIDTYKNNLELVEKCAEKYPDYSFVMIGPEKVADPHLDLSGLKSMPNIYFLGMKPWEETPKYFAYFDAYFIPYNLNDYTIKGCFPVKYFEALAVGLPTIVTNLPAYKEFDVDGYVSNTDQEFIKNIRRAIEEDSVVRRKRRIELAKKNSWDKKVNKQLNLIGDVFAKDR